MMCAECGTRYLKDDAQSQFENYYHFDLSYFMEIDEKLCGGCSVDWMSICVLGGQHY